MTALEFADLSPYAGELSSGDDEWLAKSRGLTRATTGSGSAVTACMTMNGCLYLSGDTTAGGGAADS